MITRPFWQTWLLISIESSSIDIVSFAWSQSVIMIFGKYEVSSKFLMFLITVVLISVDLVVWYAFWLHLFSKRLVFYFQRQWKYMNISFVHFENHRILWVRLNWLLLTWMAKILWIYKCTCACVAFHNKINYF